MMRRPDPGRRPRWRRRTLALAGIVLCAAVASGCAGSATSPQSRTPVVRVATVAGLPLSRAQLEAFTARTGIRVEVSTVPSDLQLASRVEDGRVRADIAIGLPAPNTSALGESRALLPYTSTASGDGAVDFAYVRSNRLTAYSYDFVCAAFDASRTEAPAPTRLSDFVRSEYRGQLTLPDPRRSSAGLAFVLAANDQTAPEGGDAWKTYWADLAANDAHLQPGADPAGAVASTPLRVLSPSRAGVPNAEVIGSTCTRRVHYAGIIAGSRHVNQAKRLIDALLAAPWQRTLPADGAFPVTTGVGIPARMRTLRQLWERNGENNTDAAADDTRTPAMLRTWRQAFRVE